jgi:hypothetical protein
MSNRKKKFTICQITLGFVRKSCILLVLVFHGRVLVVNRPNYWNGALQEIAIIIHHDTHNSIRREETMPMTPPLFGVGDFGSILQGFIHSFQKNGAVQEQELVHHDDGARFSPRRKAARKGMVYAKCLEESIKMTGYTTHAQTSQEYGPDEHFFYASRAKRRVLVADGAYSRLIGEMAKRLGLGGGREVLGPLGSLYDAQRISFLTAE